MSITRKFLPAMALAPFVLTAVLTHATAAPAHAELNAAEDAQPRVIVAQGTSHYTIVLGAEASPSERHAASELQAYVREMTGCLLSIAPDDARPAGDCIFVGDSAPLRRLDAAAPWAALGDEGFVMKTAGRDLVLAGGRQRGTLYAVYGLLERLGVRWLTPTATRVPHETTLAIGPLDVVERPGLRYREISSASAVDRDWAARHRLNGNHQHLDAAAGGKIGYRPYVHSFNQLLPPEQYFDAHPEYYALVGGVRRHERAQLCLSNPDVVRIAAERVLQWIAETPEAAIFSVSQNDSQGWCECDRCRAIDEAEGAHSGSLLRFVNQVADIVARTHPDKLIDTLAYTYTETPPQHERARPNVAVRLCHMLHCDTHPLATCEENRGFVENLKGWAKICDHVYVWHYVVDFSSYALPFPNLDAIRQDIKFYRDNGVEGIYCQASENERTSTDFAELKSDLLARLLWNPDADGGAIIDAFLSDYYGHAARPLRAYLDLLQAKVRTENIHANLYTEPGDARYLTDEVLARADALFDEAEQAADDPAIRQRVRKARLSLDYAYVARPLRYVIKGPDIQAENASTLRPRLERYAATAQAEDIEFYRYNRPDHIGTVASFVAEKRFLLESHPISAVAELAAPVRAAIESIKDWIRHHCDADGTITFLTVHGYIESRGLLGREVIAWLKQDGFLARPDRPGDRFKVVDSPTPRPSPP